MCSGASSHMTNNHADLVLNVEESNAVVQVANDVLIRAELRGTVQVRIEGVETWFHPKHTTLHAVDSDTGEAHSFSVAKPFTLPRNIDGLSSASSQRTSTTQQNGAQQKAHALSMQSTATVVIKRAMSSDLLHH
jgi:hypothetical protein